jgi:hypothetical protein
MQQVAGMGREKDALPLLLTTIIMQIFKLLFEGYRREVELSSTQNYNITQRLRC